MQTWQRASSLMFVGFEAATRSNDALSCLRLRQP